MDTLHHSVNLLLNVPHSVASIGVNGELRREPLQLRQKVLSIKYWLRFNFLLHIAHLVGLLHYTPTIQFNMDVKYKN